MDAGAWAREFGSAIVVCDDEGVILEMNEMACAAFAADGGGALVGKNLLECHPPPARAQVEQMLSSRKPNVYTIEKNGVKKLIYQAPWFEKGEFGGFVELSLVIPFDMPHFVRGPKG